MIRCAVALSAAAVASASIVKVPFGRRPIFIDLVDVRCPTPTGLSGNKVRKLQFLAKAQPFPAVVVSYGGAQSNAMAAIARLTAGTPTTFVYFVKRLPSFLRAAPSGNLAAALAAGMRLIEVHRDSYQQLAALPKQTTPFPAAAAALLPANVANAVAAGSGCWLPQGAATAEAEAGVAGLVNDIAAHVAALPGNRWKVVFASGTGTMALFAARRFNQLKLQNEKTTFEAVAVPCVGDARDLLEQMSALDAVSGGLGVFPTILGLQSTTDVATVAFGTPCRAHLEIWRELRAATSAAAGADVDFDLIYAPRAFELLLDSFDRESTYWDGCNVLYYHCGGAEGNESQLGRYRHLQLL